MALPSHQYYSFFEGRWASPPVRIALGPRGRFTLPSRLGHHLRSSVTCELERQPPVVHHATTIVVFGVPVLQMLEDFVLDESGTDLVAQVKVVGPFGWRPIVASLTGSVSVKPQKAAQYHYRTRLFGFTLRATVRTAWQGDHLEVTQTTALMTATHHLRRMDGAASQSSGRE